MASLITDFFYTKNLVFDTTVAGVNIASSPTNVPIYVQINDDSWPLAVDRSNFFCNANVSGKRIQFFDSDGVTNLSYEKILYDKPNEHAIYVVQVPTITGNDNTDYITVAYGNDPNGSDQDDSTGVWDDPNGMGQMGAVWHLNERFHNSSAMLKSRYTACRYVGVYDRTYFTYISHSDFNIYVNYVDNTDGYFGTPVSVDADLVDYNVHQCPIIQVIQNGTYAGRIVVAWPDLDDIEFHTIRSTNTEDISAWEVKETLDYGTYASLFEYGDDIGGWYLGIVKTYTDGDNHFCNAFYSSSDGADNWSSALEIIDFGQDASTTNGIYNCAVADGNEIHVAGNYGYNGKDYYMMSPDNGATWYDYYGGSEITLPADSTTMAKVYDVSGAGHDTWVCDIQPDENNAHFPIILTEDQNTGATPLISSLIWIHYDSGWSAHDTGLDARNPDDALIAYHSGGNIDPEDTTQILVGSIVGNYNIVEYKLTDHATNTWTKQTDVTSVNEATMCYEPKYVRNYVGSVIKYLYTMMFTWTDYDTHASVIVLCPSAGEESVRDSTSNNIDGYAHGGYTNTSGPVLYAREYSGVNNFKDVIPQDAVLDALFGDDFSISFWGTWNSTGVWNFSFDYGRNFTVKTEVYIGRDTSDKLQAGLQYNAGGASDKYTSNTAFTNVATPRHIMVTYDRSTRTFLMYINGTEDGQATANVGATPTVSFDRDGYIGNYVATDALPLTGIVAELRIYDGVMTADWAKLEYYTMKIGTNWLGDDWLSWSAQEEQFKKSFGPINFQSPAIV